MSDSLNMGRVYSVCSVYQVSPVVQCTILVVCLKVGRVTAQCRSARQEGGVLKINMRARK